MAKNRFSVSDLAQQMVGGFLLAGPFVVTEEVWKLAEEMTNIHLMVAIVVVLFIGYGALYGADEDREVDEEKEAVGIPLRLISLISISYISVAVLMTIFNAPATFGASNFTVLKVLGISAIFSEIGAATADTLF